MMAVVHTAAIVTHRTAAVFSSSQLAALACVSPVPAGGIPGAYTPPWRNSAWRERMKSLALAAVFCAPIALFPQQPVPEIKFQAQTDFLKLPPDLYFGEVAGVAVNSKGHIFVFSRGSTTGPAYGAAAAQLLEFDANGKYMREIGHHLYAWS